MLRSAASKVMWVGKATVFLVGLAVILALVLGVASTVSAHTGNTGLFHLGHRNVSNVVSTLVKQGPGPALNLMVQSGQPPLKVNSSGKVRNLNADQFDGKDSTAFVQGRGKVYVGRVVVPTTNTFPNEVVITVPGFAQVRALNCQSAGANASLEGFDQSRGTLSVWRDAGAADPNFSKSPPLSAWSSNFQVTERTMWHLSVGTGSSAEGATIDVYTQVDGSNCIYSATAQTWGP